MPVAAGLHHVVHGRSGASALGVLLVHGAGGTHLHWPPPIRRLSGATVYAPDLPGHGRSPGPACETISDAALSLIAFMDAVGLDNAAIVGHSMGSAIAMTMALQFPGRVLGLALLGAASRLRVSSSIITALQDPLALPAAIHLILDYSFSQWASPRLRELAERRANENPQAVWRADFLACDAFDATDHVSSLRVPVLLLAASHDRMTPLREAERLRGLIPQARLEVLKNCGHMMMLERPGAVTAALEAFVSGIIPRRPATA